MPKKLEGTKAPSHARFPPKSSDQNSEIAILFTRVEKPNNYVFGDILLPNSPRGKGCKLQTYFDLCLHIVMVIGKCRDVFRGIFWFGGRFEGGGIWEDLSLEEFVIGEENFNEGDVGFSSIIFKKKQWKNKYEKCFRLKVRSSIKT